MGRQRGPRCRTCEERTRYDRQIARDLRRVVSQQRTTFRALLADERFPTEEARSTATDAVALEGVARLLLRLAYELRGLCPHCAYLLEQRDLNRRLALNELPTEPCSPPCTMLTASSDSSSASQETSPSACSPSEGSPAASPSTAGGGGRPSTSSPSSPPQSVPRPATP